MKLATKLTALKQRKQTERKSGHDKGGTFGLWHWTVLALCLLLVGGGTWAVFEFFIWTRLPSDLVGKWMVQAGPMSGGTFEFSRNGALETRIKDGTTHYTLK